MTTNLQDSSLPAWEVVRQNPDGVRVRNDGTELQPAQTNPWYVLSTIHGEYEDDYWSGRSDLEARNRRSWNAWMLSSEQTDNYAELLRRYGLDETEYPPPSDDELVELMREFRRRLPGQELPDPKEGLNLENLYFDRPLILSGFLQLNFTDIIINKSVFNSTVSFHGLSIGGRIYAEDACFKANAIFRNFSSPDVCYFTRSVFLQNLDFSNSSFGQNGIFSEAKFFEHTVFDGCTWYRNAYFDGAVFEKNSSFRNININAEAYFENSTYLGLVSFDGAVFADYASFNDTTFKSSTSFHGALFEFAVPKFYQTELHQDTSFPLQLANWPLVTTKTGAWHQQEYGQLRRIFNSLKRADEEYFFFRQEMRCRAINEPWPDKIALLIYWLVSDFGYSITRPFVMLFVVFSLGWPIIASYLKNSTDIGTPIATGLGLSISNTLPFLGFGRTLFSGFFQTTPWWVNAISGLQSILGVILIFFLALGLRNRFRLK